MKNNKLKVKATDKVAGLLFNKVIETALDQYDKSAEKETMSFRAFCIGLVGLSNKRIGNDDCLSFDLSDEESQLELQKGE